MSSETDFVPAFDAPSLPLGEIAKSKLESEGIQVMIKGGSAYAYPTGTAWSGRTAGAVGPVRRCRPCGRCAAGNCSGSPVRTCSAMDIFDIRFFPRARAGSAGRPGKYALWLLGCESVMCIA